MKSHSYEFNGRGIGRLLCPPVLVVASFAAVMHLGAIGRVLPAPRPTLDIDRTVLLHQAESARSTIGANLLLIGDSSCLMDVDARSLGKPLGLKALNLGTLSYLDFEQFARLLAHYFQVNPEPPSTVVVLVHPEFLRRFAAEPEHVALLDRYYRAQDYCPSRGVHGKISCAAGLEIFKGRIWCRFVPAPLADEFRVYYGFTRNLWRFMSDHAGSAVDPRRFVVRAGEGNADYRLSRRVSTSGPAVRAAVPAGVRLLVGVTPVPASFAPPNYAARYRQIIEEWSRAAAADGVLAGLPPTLPDHLFASTTHLTEEGQKTFTRILSAELRSQR